MACMFGKYSDAIFCDEFHLDTVLPMSPLQAFGVAIAQFHGR